METMGIVQARTNISRIISEGKPVEIRSPKGTSIILSKADLERRDKRIEELEIALIMKEMDLAELSDEPRFTTEEVFQIVFKGEHGLLDKKNC